MFRREVEKPKEGVTYGELLDRYVLLDRVKGLTGDKLCFARRKNLMMLRAFEKQNSMASRIPVSPEFEEYQTEYAAIRGKHLLTDKEGKSVMQQSLNAQGLIETVPVVDVANPQLIAKLEELQEKFQLSIKERNDDMRAYREFLDETIPSNEMPNFHKVQKKEATDLTQEQVDAIAWFVEE